MFFFDFPEVSLGPRLAAMRKRVGLTQAELAEKIGASRRAIAYYEGEDTLPPTWSIIPKLASVFEVTTDQLLGVSVSDGQSISILTERMQQMEKLDFRTKQQLYQVIDTFIEAEKMKNQLKHQKTFKFIRHDKSREPPNKP